jgi:hypothetical protein
MRIPRGWFLIVAIASVMLSSCGKKGPPRVPLVGPVTGQVLVDGQPAKGVRIIGQSSAPIDTKNPAIPSATTEEDGKFSMYTYSPGDGMPAGDYVLLFTWQEGPFTKPGPDKLKGRYATPAKSTVKCKAEKGKVDLGKIELTTK